MVYVAAAMLGTGVALEPLLRAVSPALAVECALRQGSRLDPWGNAFVFDLKQGFAVACHSMGPNGIDENCGGDDINGVAGHLGFAIEPDTFWWSVLAWTIAPSHVIGIAVVIGWFVLAPRLWASDRQSLGVELISALILAALPIGLTWVVVSFLWGAAGWTELAPAGPLLIPVQAGAAGTVSFLVYLFALRRRVTRPLAGQL